jgi:hypothetical protein
MIHRSSLPPRSEAKAMRGWGLGLGGAVVGVGVRVIVGSWWGVIEGVGVRVIVGSWWGVMEGVGVRVIVGSWWGVMEGVGV